MRWWAPRPLTRRAYYGCSALSAEPAAGAVDAAAVAAANPRRRELLPCRARGCTYVQPPRTGYLEDEIQAIPTRIGVTTSVTEEAV